MTEWKLPKPKWWWAFIFFFTVFQCLYSVCWFISHLSYIEQDIIFQVCMEHIMTSFSLCSASNEAKT